MPDAGFWDKRADRYSRSPIKDMASYEKTLECTRKHLSTTDRVLEVGCGTGTIALLLAPSVEHILATDISTRMIEIAREKAAAQGVDNAEFERATLDDGALPSAAFDAVLAFNFLHLLEDIPGSLDRIHDLLKPGGLFISKTVCLAERSRLLGLVIALMRVLGMAPYASSLRIAELEQLIRSAGFEIVEAGSYPHPNRYLVARRA